jgi:hypothetical protein
MATLTLQGINRLGVTPTYAAANAGGDAMPCGNTIFLHIKNSNAATRTVTLVVPAAILAAPNIAITSPAIVVAATIGDMMIGPVLPQFFQDPVTGLCSITYSAATNVTVAAIQLSQP